MRIVRHCVDCRRAVTRNLATGPHGPFYYCDGCKYGRDADSLRAVIRDRCERMSKYHPAPAPRKDERTRDEQANQT